MNIRSQQFFCVPYSRGLMANQLYDPLTYRINGQCFQKKKWIHPQNTRTNKMVWIKDSSDPAFFKNIESCLWLSWGAQHTYAILVPATNYSTLYFRIKVSLFQNFFTLTADKISCFWFNFPTKLLSIRLVVI